MQAALPAVLTHTSSESIFVLFALKKESKSEYCSIMRVLMSNYFLGKSRVGVDCTVQAVVAAAALLPLSQLSQRCRHAASARLLTHDAQREKG